MKMTSARSSFCLALLFALGIMSMEHARSGPPSPPPPAGKILFAYAATATIWEMNGDGTGQSNSGLSFGSIGDPVPSAVFHGVSRWWLINMAPIPGGETDLGVTNGITTIRLTNSGYIVNPDETTQTHVKFSHGGRPSWSNDGADSFCSVRALRYVLTPATPTTNEIISNPETVIYRLNIDDADWTRITNPSSVLGAFLPCSQSDRRITSVIKSTLPHVNFTLGEHHWRPDGNAITFINGNKKVPTSAADLFVRVLLDPVTLLPVNDVNVDALVPIVGYQPGTSGVTGPRWCPTTGDNRILYQSYWQICTILPGNPVINLASGERSPFWSPDGAYVVYDKTTTKGINRIYNVWRVPSTGGTSVNLTSKLDAFLSKQLKGWSK